MTVTGDEFLSQLDELFQLGVEPAIARAAPFDLDHLFESRFRQPGRPDVDFARSLRFESVEADAFLLHGCGTLAAAGGPATDVAAGGP